MKLKTLLIGLLTIPLLVLMLFVFKQEEGLNEIMDSEINKNFSKEVVLCKNFKHPPAPPPQTEEENNEYKKKIENDILYFYKMENKNLSSEEINSCISYDYYLSKYEECLQLALRNNNFKMAKENMLYCFKKI